MTNNTESVRSFGSVGSVGSVKSTLPRECTYAEKPSTSRMVYENLSGDSLKNYCDNYHKYLEIKQKGFGGINPHPNNIWGKATTINGKKRKYNLPRRLCECQYAIDMEGIHEFNYDKKLQKEEQPSSSSGFHFGGKKRKSLKKGRKTKRKKTKKVKKTKKAKKTKKNKVKK